MRICIVCRKEMAGKAATPIKEDFIIRGIRAVKRFFHVATNNELYVCEEDLPLHMQKRKSFERSIIFFGVLAAAVVVLLIGTIILSGRFDIVAIISAVIIGIFILLFSIVFKYAPAVKETAARTGKPAVPEELEELEEKKPRRKAGKRSG